MQSHKNIKKFLKEHLPPNYKHSICAILGLEYSSKTEQKIYRVRVGQSHDLDIMNAMFDLAIKHKKAKQKILKQQ